MSDDHDEEQAPVPASADAAASQKALSSINANGNDDDSAAKTNVDKDALSAAAKAAESKKKPAVKQPAVLVKVDDKDVKILIDQFEFTKAKATELLRKHNADLRATATAVIRGEA